MSRRAALSVLIWLATTYSSQAQKEFADCGSSALMPLKLELDPDPAEVFAHATPVHKFAAEGMRDNVDDGGGSQACGAAQQVQRGCNMTPTLKTRLVPGHTHNNLLWRLMYI